MSAAIKTRRLSPWRVLFGVSVLVVVVAVSALSIFNWQTNKSTISDEPWFAPYVDVTSTPTFAFDQLGSTKHKDAMLSFVVSSKNDPCTPSWGAAYTLDQASARLDLDRRIARLQQQGGHVAVSFGGVLNDELAVKCTDEAKLEQAYKSVIERYHIDTIDLDLESTGLQQDAQERRAKVLAKIQQERRASDEKLAIWVTLPVIPSGLTEDGTNAVAALLKHVDLAGVNVMTMNYGQAIEEGQGMADASKAALTQTHRQLGILYKQAGIRLNEGTLWSKIGATPMIGQNEFKDEVFNVDDAQALNKFAQSKHIGRMSMWSANRDTPCGSNYVDVKKVSDSCSGVKSPKGSFADTLSSGFGGNMSSSAGIVTKNDDAESTKQTKDDPASSPYQIWTEVGAYLEGTKVVWHGNVYQAKWWTKGDVPDSPVLQAYQTPWELIGPVLPGEKPVEQPTLPAGTYPEWSGDEAYDTGVRILFDGVPYQAKWWSRGDSPAAASSNADSSPWVALTQAEIDVVLQGGAAN